MRGRAAAFPFEAAGNVSVLCLLLVTMQGAERGNWWIAPAVILLSCGPAPADPHEAGRTFGPAAANEILTMMLATYATAATYVDEGELKDVYTRENGRRTETIAPMGDVFARPDHFRFVLGPTSNFPGEHSRLKPPVSHGVASRGIPQSPRHPKMTSTFDPDVELTVLQVAPQKTIRA